MLRCSEMTENDLCFVDYRRRHKFKRSNSTSISICCGLVVQHSEQVESELYATED